MSKAKLQSALEAAISAADDSFFFENYPKQAKAAIAAIERAGFTLIPAEIPVDTWEKAANQMKTGRLKPHEHVKDVFEVVLKMVKL